MCDFRFVEDHSYVTCDFFIFSLARRLQLPVFVDSYYSTSCAAARCTYPGHKRSSLQEHSPESVVSLTVAGF